jgi:hypothetical protein
MKWLMSDAGEDKVDVEMVLEKNAIDESNVINERGES